MSVSADIRKMIDGNEGINYTLASGLLDRLEALEKHIEETENAPHFRTNPNNPAQQKITIAGRLYKEYSASYRDTIIKLYKMICDDVSDNTTSPLREYYDKIMKAKFETR